MAYHRVLTLQDLSCLGQVAGSAALAVLSACGAETCLVPTALLSNHTAARFGGFHFRDLTEEIGPIAAQWQRIGVQFDAVSTGYLGSLRQVELAAGLFDLLKPEGLRIVDPAMADHGKLYTGFDGAFVEAMKGLCAKADILLPNITEAALLTGLPYREEPEDGYIDALLRGLLALGPRSVLLTGVGDGPETTGFALAQGETVRRFTQPKVGAARHGTGDIFAAAFTGALLAGQEAFAAGKTAALFTAKCIENTMDDPDHWYGVKFETALPELMRLLGRV